MRATSAPIQCAHLVAAMAKRCAALILWRSTGYDAGKVARPITEPRLALESDGVSRLCMSCRAWHAFLALDITRVKRVEADVGSTRLLQSNFVEELSSYCTSGGMSLACRMR